MRQPLWIINCALLALFFLGSYIMLFLQPKIPRAASLQPKPFLVQPKNIAPINLKSIYENDLFKTHIPGEREYLKEDLAAEIPAPPQYRAAKSHQADNPLFLDPLPITVTGIMVFGSEQDNRTIIQDNRSKKEASYKIGDDLEDAQIVRILRNKVVIIRSNSQQETLFLREQDAILELESIAPNWKEIFKPIEENKYSVDADEFVSQIKTLGKLVDELNIITAYKDGINTGAKIGNGTQTELVSAMGLQAGDIIESINNVAVNSTDGRFKAYKQVVDPKTVGITVRILRKDERITLNYQLKKTPKDNAVQNINNASMVKQHVEENKSKFNKTANKVRNRDKNHLAKFKNKISQSMHG